MGNNFGNAREHEVATAFEYRRKKNEERDVDAEKDFSVGNFREMTQLARTELGDDNWHVLETYSEKRCRRLVAMSVRLHKEGNDGHVAPRYMQEGRSPTFREFVEGCSPVHVWNLVLIGKVDNAWLDMWATTMQGRNMRDANELCGKEIRDMLHASERFRFDVNEVTRRHAMFESDPENVWHEVCSRWVDGGECEHMLNCRKIHCNLRA